jgi:hypothetical protein
MPSSCLDLTRPEARGGSCADHTRTLDVRAHQIVRPLVTDAESTAVKLFLHSTQLSWCNCRRHHFNDNQWVKLNHKEITQSVLLPPGVVCCLKIPVIKQVLMGPISVFLR